MINNSLFKLPEIPKFHPISQRYERKAFWDEQRRYIIEGYWVGGKWMPPELYYYINFHHITLEKGIYKGIALPWCRDVEWEKAYLYSEAIGFSGFENDQEYSCNRLLDDSTITDEDLKRQCKIGNETDTKFYNNLFKSDDTRKSFVHARDYIKRIFPSDMGKPLYYNRAMNIMEVAGRGYGKDLEANTIVHTENGPVPIKDINVGDQIFGADGNLTTVTSKTNFVDQLQYQVTFSDGRIIECGGGHLWNVYKKDSRLGYKYLTISLEDIYKDYKIGKRGDARYYVEICKPLKYKEKKLPIDPYFLGLWLGDGNSHNTGITTQDAEIIDYVYAVADDWNLHININQNKNKTCPTYNINCKKDEISTIGNPLKRELRNLNLIQNKHIPDIYLYSSFEQRLSLLQGLMDSDGYVGKAEQFEICTSYKGLQKTILTLIHSLGIRCKYKIKKTVGKDTLLIRLFTELPLFRLKRKKDRIKKINSKYSLSNMRKSAIVDIKPTSVKPSVCIGVDNQDCLFVAGEGHIVTHNSYWTSGLTAHNFITGGAKDYDLYLQLLKEGIPLKSETVIGAIDTKYSSKLTDKIKTGLDKLPGSEIIRVDGESIVYPSPLALNCEGSFAVGKAYKAIYTGSQIQHVTFADKPMAANGGRPNRIFIDEVGFMNNILETWSAIESTQSNESFKRLTIYGMGTGGLTSAGAVTYVQEIFYNPEAYDCLTFEDKWENKGKICYFTPTTFSNNEYKEGPNFITNEERALQDVLKEREIAKKARSKKKLLGLIINKPLVPSEIFLRSEGTFFPIEDLKQALGELETNKLLLSSSWKVDLLLDSTGKVITKPSNKLPIRDYPLTGAVDMDACIEIFEKPKSGESSEIISGRYFIVTDPVDNDGNDDIKRSLQSSFVYDAWVDRIVAEYTARTYLASQYYENVRRLALYYNAKILYENNKKGLFAHFKNKGSVSMLLETPKLIKDQTKDKDISVGNKMYGVNMNTDILKLHAIELLKEWLVKQAYNENDGVMNLQKLRSIALIKELIAYTMDLNADRVSALLILMILLEDKQRIIESNKKLGTTNTEEVKKDDDFWKRAYNGRRLNVYSGLNSFYH